MSLDGLFGFTAAQWAGLLKWAIAGFAVVAGWCIVQGAKLVKWWVESTQRLMRETHESQMQMLKEVHEQRLAQLKEVNEQRVGSLKESHAERITQLRELLEDCREQSPTEQQRRLEKDYDVLQELMAQKDREMEELKARLGTLDKESRAAGALRQEVSQKEEELSVWKNSAQASKRLLGELQEQNQHLTELQERYNRLTTEIIDGARADVFRFLAEQVSSAAALPFDVSEFKANLYTWLVEGVDHFYLAVAEDIARFDWTKVGAFSNLTGIPRRILEEMRFSLKLPELPREPRRIRDDLIVSVLRARPSFPKNSLVKFAFSDSGGTQPTGQSNSTVEPNGTDDNAGTGK